MSLSAFMHPFARPTAEEFITIVRGEGARVIDSDGKSYVDALASLWYCNIGHGRVEMAEAVAAQIRVLEAFHTFDQFSNEPAERLADTLAALAPFDGARVFFTSSGSEAVDSAIKIARIAQVLRGQPQRTVVVSRRNAYHGVTYGGLSAQGLEPNKEGFGPLLPDIVQVDQDDVSEMGELFKTSGDRVAAVLTEPVMGAGGVYPPAPGYLAELRRLCDEHHAYLIFDEIICGFGRLGRWWGSVLYGVRPDLVTFAKGVTSGYQPLGGVLVGPAVREALESNPEFLLRHGHTYSGHPTACVAGSKALDITMQEELLDRAPAIGKRLADGLRELEREGLIAEARGEGAIWAAGMQEEISAIEVRAEMIELGVIARAIGPHTVAISPPLVIEDDELDRILETLEVALRSASGGR